MAEIYVASPGDTQDIICITRLAFEVYKSELLSNTPVKALEESEEDVINDIIHNHVYVAKSCGKAIGCIRIKKLDEKLAYIYRFSVDPNEHSSGVGSKLLEVALKKCQDLKVSAVALHTNAKYFKLARYYYGKQFYVHSTSAEKGYIRALFVKELSSEPYSLESAYTL